MVANKNFLTEEEITRRMINKITNQSIKGPKRLNEDFGVGNTPNNNNGSTINDNMNQDANVSIPINNNTFQGILDSEQEKISQKLPNIEFEDNCFMFNPSNNTVSFTGIIKNMSNLRWYFTTDTSTPDGGCYIFVEGLQLNDSTLQTLNILKGHYDAWSKDWSAIAIRKKLNVQPDEIKRLQEKYGNVNYFKI